MILMSRCEMSASPISFSKQKSNRRASTKAESKSLCLHSACVCMCACVNISIVYNYFRFSLRVRVNTMYRAFFNYALCSMSLDFAVVAWLPREKEKIRDETRQTMRACVYIFVLLVLHLTASSTQRLTSSFCQFYNAVFVEVRAASTNDF